MGTGVVEVSRALFEEHLLPAVQAHLPDVAMHGVFGLFGYGSEAYGLDDDLSRDHHWGLRIDCLLPQDLLESLGDALQGVAAEALPGEFRGVALRTGHHAGAGLALDGLEAFLARTIGIPHAPQTNEEWLALPEEDVLHITNGEVWSDPEGQFSSIRQALLGYYPEPVRLRRIAHWCRYFSGMGVYALHRALARGNTYYASIAFGKAIRWGAQLAFLADRVYCPYDKWTFAYLDKLPRFATRLPNLLNAASSLACGWPRKQELLNELADMIDAALVEDGVIRPHERFTGSPTSGYRLLEHAYAEIIQGLPAELKTVVPQWDQVYLEQFHSGYVDSLELNEWDQILGLRG